MRNTINVGWGRRGVARVPFAAAAAPSRGSPSRLLTELGMLELPASVAELTSLRKIWLTHNALRALPDSLARLTRLEALLAPDNVFKELPQAGSSAGVVHRGAHTMAEA